MKTKKHMYHVNGNEMEKMEIKKNACKCGKTYSTNSGLFISPISIRNSIENSLPLYIDTITNEVFIYNPNI